MNHIVGEGWNQRFRDAAALTDVTDVVIDFGNTTVHRGQATSDQDTLLVEQTATAGNNYQDTYIRWCKSSWICN